MLSADAVFEGGGVKGIGLIGAVCCFEKFGYNWMRFAGTSAGAIVASLLAAGYCGDELKKILMTFDYSRAIFKNIIDHRSLRCPMGKNPVNFFTDKGLYSGKGIEYFIEVLLERKGKTKFKDMIENGESRLKILATDITRKRLLILPDGLKDYGIDPMEFKISRAVRMSIGIPFFFKPVKLYGNDSLSYIVDGGLLSNYPIWIFDSKDTPRWPTIGFKLIEPVRDSNPKGQTDIISYTLDIIDTMIEGTDNLHIHHEDFVRTVPIPTMGVKTVDFTLTPEKSLKLFNSGYESAEKFLDRWNFERYVNEYRS